MEIGYIISLATMLVLMIFILFLMIPFDRKHIVRHANRKIDFSKTTIYFRWNRFDTLTLCLVIYVVLCAQILHVLIASGYDVKNPFVQFLTNQTQTWIIVISLYLLTRITNTLKAIKERWGDELK